MKTFLLLIGIIAVVFGVKFVFDARPIIKKYFTNTSQDKNEASFVLKGIGFALLILGSILIYFYY